MLTCCVCWKEDCLSHIWSLAFSFKVTHISRWGKMVTMCIPLSDLSLEVSWKENDTFKERHTLLDSDLCNKWPLTKQYHNIFKENSVKQNRTELIHKLSRPRRHATTHKFWQTQSCVGDLDVFKYIWLYIQRKRFGHPGKNVCYYEQIGHKFCTLFKQKFFAA